MPDFLFDIATLNQNTIEKLKTYEEFLVKWNRNFKIFSSNSNINIWNRHILDSLQMVPLINNSNKLADMGTGIGLPSIPLAIACPSINIFAIETNKKKSSLISELVHILALSNLHLLPERVESVVVSHMDVVCCRAFGEFIRDANIAYKMLKPGGLFMTFKSTAENRIPNGFKNVSNHKYRLRNYSKDFYIVVTQKIGDLD